MFSEKMIKKHEFIKDTVVTKNRFGVLDNSSESEADTVFVENITHQKNSPKITILKRGESLEIPSRNQFGLLFPECSNFSNNIPETSAAGENRPYVPRTYFPLAPQVTLSGTKGKSVSSVSKPIDLPKPPSTASRMKAALELKGKNKMTYSKQEQTQSPSSFVPNFLKPQISIPQRDWASRT